MPITVPLVRRFNALYSSGAGETADAEPDVDN